MDHVRFIAVVVFNYAVTRENERTKTCNREWEKIALTMGSNMERNGIKRSYTFLCVFSFPNVLVTSRDSCAVTHFIR